MVGFQFNDSVSTAAMVAFTTSMTMKLANRKASVLFSRQQRCDGLGVKDVSLHCYRCACGFGFMVF
jgi:hypothetical protein